MKKILQARRNIVEFSNPSNNLIDTLRKKYSTTQNSVHSYPFFSLAQWFSNLEYIYVCVYIYMYIYIILLYSSIHNKTLLYRVLYTITRLKNFKG